MKGGLSAFLKGQVILKDSTVGNTERKFSDVHKDNRLVCSLPETQPWDRGKTEWEDEVTWQISIGDDTFGISDTASRCITWLI